MVSHNKSQNLSLQDKILLNYERELVGKSDQNDILQGIMNNKNTKQLLD